MTLTSTTNRVNYSSTAGLAAYPIPFSFQDATDIYLFFNKALCSTGFTVSGGSGSTGTLTFTSPPPQATDLIIVRWMDLTQIVDLSDHDALPAAALEQQGLDRLVMLIQQEDELNDRALSLEPFSCYTGLTVPDPVAGKVLAWKSDLSGLENVTGGAKGDTGATGPQGPAGAGAAPDITDCSTTVTLSTAVVFAGPLVTVDQLYGTPKVARVTVAAVSPTVTAPPRVVGLAGANNSGTPATQYDFAATYANVFNCSTHTTLVLPGVATRTLNISTSGPAAGGRDQADAFAINSWVYPYLIAKDDGTYHVTAAVHPPPQGPTLPATYTRWAPLPPLRITAAGELSATHTRGPAVWWDTGQAMLSDGRALTETAIALAGAVPPEATLIHVWIQHLIGGTTAVKIRLASGTANLYAPPFPGSGFATAGGLTLPNVAQTLYYLWGVDPGALNGLYLTVMGYEWAG